MAAAGLTSSGTSPKIAWFENDAGVLNENSDTHIIVDDICQFPDDRVFRCRAVAAADFDGDGDPDVISGNQNNDPGNEDKVAFHRNQHVGVIDAKSLRIHELGGPNQMELAIDLDDCLGVEPRLGGPSKLTFQMSKDMNPSTVVTGNVQIDCAAGPEPPIGPVGLAGDNRTVTVELGGALPDQNCCELSFTGMQSAAGDAVSDTFLVRALRGDVDFNWAVTGADPLLVKPHFGESLAGGNLSAPQWDYNLDGAVTGADHSLIKPLIGNMVPACP